MKTNLHGIPVLSRLAELDAYWSQRKVIRNCYVCGMPFEIYDILPTEPPQREELEAITDISQIKTIYTCEDPACRKREHERQDALYSYVLADKIAVWKKEREEYIQGLRKQRKF